MEVGVGVEVGVEDGEGFRMQDEVMGVPCGAVKAEICVFCDRSQSSALPSREVDKMCFPMSKK